MPKIYIAGNTTVDNGYIEHAGENFWGSIYPLFDIFEYFSNRFDISVVFSLDLGRLKMV